MINEEIELALKDINDGILFEQQAPPNPTAPPTTEDPKKDSEEDPEKKAEDIKKKIDSLAKSSDEDIVKTLKAGLQGSKSEETLAIMSKIIHGSDSDDDAVPENVKRVVDQFQEDFDVDVPEEEVKPAAPPPAVPVPGQPQATPAPPATPAPIKESRLQTSLREYLSYKKLYQRTSNRK